MELFEFIMEEERQSLKRHRLLKDFYDPLEVLDDAQCIALNRFDRRSFIELVNIDQSKLQHCTYRNRPLHPITQVLIGLKYFGTGMNYRTRRSF